MAAAAEPSRPAIEARHLCVWAIDQLQATCSVAEAGARLREVEDSKKLADLEHAAQVEKLQLEIHEQVNRREEAEREVLQLKDSIQSLSAQLHAALETRGALERQLEVEHNRCSAAEARLEVEL